MNASAATGGEQLDWVERFAELEVQPADVFGSGQLPLPEHGSLLVPADWSFS